MSFQVILPLTDSAISSLALAHGVMPSGKLAGQTTDPSGQAPALASLSARQAREAGLLTSGTSGPLGFGSLASADVALSLVSRLHPVTDLLGSTLFVLTWKGLATPSGRLIYALRASGLRTSGSGCTSWPTCIVNDATGSKYAYAGGNHDKLVLKLPGAAQLASWATPAARDHKDGSCQEQLKNGTVEIKALLGRQALLTDSGLTLTGSPVKTARPGQLNPAHSRWLMGLPPEWGDCGVTAMP